MDRGVLPCESIMILDTSRTKLPYSKSVTVHGVILGIVGTAEWTKLIGWSE